MENNQNWSRRKFSKAIISAQLLIASGVLSIASSCDSDGNKKTITGMELERIRVAFAREIETKGLRFSEGNPDLTVQITVYHREALDRGYYYAPTRSYMERAVAVDFFDTRTKKHVWHCAAVGELTYDPTERSQILPELAKAIFEKYPIQPAS